MSTATPVDFFISYAGADSPWAEWIAWELEAAGYSTILQAWDFVAGHDFVHEMQAGMQRAERTIAVLTPTYLKYSPFGEAEWRAAFAVDPSGSRRSLIPIRVEPCEPQGLLRTRIYIDLVHLGPRQASERLRSTLGGMRGKPSQAPLFPVSPARSRPVSPMVADEQSTAAFALSRLLALQYPWGEWSDRRTELESRIAERRPRTSMEMPKPNLARTMFAVEAMESGQHPTIVAARREALAWMTDGVRSGWYWEWRATGTSHSEASVPEIAQQPDVRHTAQVASAIARWSTSKEHLGELISSLVESSLPFSGFWPDHPRGTQPKVLATVYCVEALALLIHDPTQMLTSVLTPTRAAQARNTLARGIAALQADLSDGAGLLGTVGGNTPNSYLTALSLFRLAPIAGRSSELDLLVHQLADGVRAGRQGAGWEDESLHPELRPLTRNRTTLRAAAALTRALSSGISLTAEELDFIRARTDQLLSPASGWALDSPDLACGLICLMGMVPDMSLDELFSQDEVDLARQANRREWTHITRSLAQELSLGRDLGIPGYSEASTMIASRLAILEADSLGLD